MHLKYYHRVSRPTSKWNQDELFNAHSWSTWLIIIVTDSVLQERQLALQSDQQSDDASYSLQVSSIRRFHATLAAN